MRKTQSRQRDNNVVLIRAITMLIVVFGHALDEYRVGGYYFENAAV